ncbi:hypothetical protein HAX54_003134, partial [Datura stramonium]|nr:hypothetical protein [Datura stramonium]
MASSLFFSLASLNHMLDFSILIGIKASAMYTNENGFYMVLDFVVVLYAHNTS